MAKKRELLRIGFDSGASAIKCHASCGDRATSLVLSTGAIKQRSETLDAYESWSSLVNAVKNILIKFGSEYIINFA